jgi:plastocyanin
VAVIGLSGLAAALPTQQYGSSESSDCGEKGCDSSSNGYDSGNSGYNYGGNSGYDGGDSSKQYDGGYNYGGSEYTTSSEKQMTTSMMEDKTTSSMMMEETTTMMMDEKSTSTSTTEMMKETMPSYGSGSSYWGGSGYNDCVNQCMATFGSDGGSYQGSETTGSAGSKGTGATHTVIVAPSDGVLRMVPFATNASIGDTVEFHWGATTQHTVTKSSALTPCNKSSDAPVFASGLQGKGFVFTQVVNNTDPTFYYCGVPGHCEKGMFGIINPKMATPGAPTSVGGMMSSMASSDADLSAYAAYANNLTANNNAAATWGTNLDMGDIPESSRGDFATNVLFTRALIGMNGEVLKEDNSIDLSSAATTPLMVPKDLTNALANNGATSAPQDQSSTSSSSSAPAGAAANAAESPAPSDPAKGAASSVTSSRLVVAAFVVLATVFAL